MRAPILGAVCVALLSAACGNDQSGPANTATVAFSVATRAVPGSSLALSGAPDTLTDGTNVLVIDTAQLVIREIELERVEGSVTCPDDDDHDGHDDGQSAQGAQRIAHASDDDEDDDCDEVHIGPYLLDLPLGAGAARQFMVEVPAGTYDEVDFKVHKPGDSDASFLAAHPEFRGRSVRVVGTWNGTPFVYTGDASSEQEAALVPPLTMAEGAGTELTLFVDLSTWFRVNGSLVDPALANEGGQWEEAVERSIKASIQAFEDRDHDGCDDNDDDD